jgi:hypothetical protein
MEQDKQLFLLYVNSKGNTVVAAAGTLPEGTNEISRVAISTSEDGITVWQVKVSKPGNKQGILTQFTCADKKPLINAAKQLDAKPKIAKAKVAHNTPLSDAEKDEFKKRIGDQIPADWTSNGTNFKERALENVDYLVGVGLLAKDATPKQVVEMNYKVNAYYSNK